MDGRLLTLGSLGLLVAAAHARGSAGIVRSRRAPTKAERVEALVRLFQAQPEGPLSLVWESVFDDVIATIHSPSELFRITEAMLRHPNAADKSLLDQILLVALEPQPRENFRPGPGLRRQLARRLNQRIDLVIPSFRKLLLLLDDEGLSTIEGFTQWPWPGSNRSRATAQGSPARSSFTRFASVPSGFSTSPQPFVKGSILDAQARGGTSPGDGLYHVTTHLAAVLADGRLRSRKELRAAGRQGAGLGGGWRDEAPSRVSVAIDLTRAQRLQEAVTTMALAVHGQIPAAEALRRMKSFSDDATSAIDRAIDWMNDGSDEDEDTSTTRAARAFDEGLDTFGKAVLAATPGPALYEALCQYEGHIAGTVSEWESEGWIPDDELVCGPTIGFTEPAHKFIRVMPDNIGLLRLAGRKTAKIEMNPRECELRFLPEDLVIVGVQQSASEQATPARSKKASKGRPPPKKKQLYKVTAPKDAGWESAVYEAERMCLWVWEVFLGSAPDTAIPVVGEAVEILESYGYLAELL